jgi:hypothetical protein
MRSSHAVKGLSDYIDQSHHFVVFVFENVAVPDVTELLARSPNRDGLPGLPCETGELHKDDLHKDDLHKSGAFGFVFITT